MTNIAMATTLNHSSKTIALAKHLNYPYVSIHNKDHDYLLVQTDEHLELWFPKKNKFKPSPYLLGMINNKTNRKIVVNEKAEWLFICGRDIHGKNITASCDVNEDDFVLILNELNECLGYAQISKMHNGEIKMLKNVYDIGDFLRRE